LEGKNLENIVACLLNSTFFHPVYGKCAQFQEEGFCADAALIVLPDLDTGTATCRPEPDPCTPDRDYSRGGIESSECGCGSSEVEHDGYCVKPFTKTSCPEGKLLVPVDFSEGHRTCPKSISCVEKNSCPNYRLTEINIKYTESESQKKLKQEFLNHLLCDEEKNSLCCPDDNEDDLLTPDNILQTYKSPQYECVDNPCQDGYWPFEDDDTGFMKCFQADDTVKNCRLDIKFHKNQTEVLSCELFALNSVLGQKKNCRQGWMWAERVERCIQLFNAA